MPTVNKLKLVTQMTHDCAGNLNFSRTNSNDNFGHYLTNGQRWSTPSSSEPGSPIRTPSPQLLRSRYSRSFVGIPEDQEVTFVRHITFFDYLRSALATFFLWPFLMYPLVCDFFEIFGDGRFIRTLAEKSLKLLDIPLLIARRLIIFIRTPPWRRNSGKGKTVLLSSASTVQALYLARHLNDYGLRVIVFDFEQNYQLSKYSTAVSKYYKLPSTSMLDYFEYITCLTSIVRNENVTLYIPVCATNFTHFDSMAKPHLKDLNCETFVSDLDDTEILQDTSRVIKICESLDIQVGYYALNNRYYEIYTTCTTVKNGKVISNLTSFKNTVKVVENEAIEKWVYNFFDRFILEQPLNGYFTLELAQSKSFGDVRLKNIAVGVPRLYVCQGKLQPEILLLDDDESKGGCLPDRRAYYMFNELIMITLLRPSFKNFLELVKTLLSGREILFSLLDPLPCLANYCIRLPYEFIVNYIKF